MSGFNRNEIDLIGHLLYPYQVSVGAEGDSGDFTICRGSPSNSSRPLIRVPLFADRHRGHMEPIDNRSTIVDLPWDLVRTCSTRLEAIMNPRISWIYKLSTHLPVRYNVVPPSIRNRILRTRGTDADLSHHVANETARKILIRAIHLLGFRLERKNPPSLLITHDIDTDKGLQRALKLKAVEENLGLRSTWFLPSDEYPIRRDIARDLADGSRIGSQDVWHDGRLIHIQRFDELVERMRKSRLKLEHLFEKEVTCFRSPLLQFSRRILHALFAAGYKSDFSAPCWEPMYPLTMSGFGVEFVQPFEVQGVTEFPLTLFQDHQVLKVLRMSTNQAVRFWLRQAKLVQSLDGHIVLCIHPDYDFSRDLSEYRILLASLQEMCASKIENIA